MSSNYFNDEVVNDIQNTKQNKHSKSIKNEKFPQFNNICEGCKHECGNQEAHMDCQSGCLHSKDFCNFCNFCN